MYSALLSRDEEAVAVCNHLQQFLQIMTAFALGTSGRRYGGFQEGKT